MRRILTCISVLLLFLSCSKLAPQPDPADTFVGEYTFSDSYFLRWGNDSRTLHHNSAFTLTKVSSNQVQMTGAWNTLGTVVGNTVSFSPCPQSDDSGYINYTFGVANLNCNQLTFSYTGTGSMRFTNGVAYPLELSGNVLATKSLVSREK